MGLPGIRSGGGGLADAGEPGSGAAAEARQDTSAKPTGGGGSEAGERTKPKKRTAPKAGNTGLQAGASSGASVTSSTRTQRLGPKGNNYFSEIDNALRALNASNSSTKNNIDVDSLKNDLFNAIEGKIFYALKIHRWTLATFPWQQERIRQAGMGVITYYEKERQAGLLTEKVFAEIHDMVYDALVDQIENYVTLLYENIDNGEKFTDHNALESKIIKMLAEFLLEPRYTDGFEALYTDGTPMRIKINEPRWINRISHNETGPLDEDKVSRGQFFKLTQFLLPDAPYKVVHIFNPMHQRIANAVMMECINPQSKHHIWKISRADVAIMEKYLKEHYNTDKDSDNQPTPVAAAIKAYYAAAWE